MREKMRDLAIKYMLMLISIIIAITVAVMVLSFVAVLIPYIMSMVGVVMLAMIPIAILALILKKLIKGKDYYKYKGDNYEIEFEIRRYDL